MRFSVTIYLFISILILEFGLEADTYVFSLRYISSCLVYILSGVSDPLHMLLTTVSLSPPFFPFVHCFLYCLIHLEGYFTFLIGLA
jgi:hypothetical protein